MKFATRQRRGLRRLWYGTRLRGVQETAVVVVEPVLLELAVKPQALELHDARLALFALRADGPRYFAGEVLHHGAPQDPRVSWVKGRSSR